MISSLEGKARTLPDILRVVLGPRKRLVAAQVCVLKGDATCVLEISFLVVSDRG